MIIETIGTIGMLLLVVCPLPQTIKSIVDGHSNGLSFWSLFISLIGAICLLTYMLYMNVPLIVMLNILTLVIYMIIQLKYKLFPRKVKDESNSI